MENTELNPWKTLKNEIVYESPWIRVEKNEVKNPAGNDAIYSVVHFKNLAIGILPLDEENNTWLVGQYRYPVDQYSWEIPEGGGDPKLPPIVSAQKELKEETGIIASEYKEIMRLHLSNSATNELAIVFVARSLVFGQAEPEETEVLKIKKLHINEAFEMCMNGEITDAISVAAIFKAKILLEKGEI